VIDFLLNTSLGTGIVIFTISTIVFALIIYVSSYFLFKNSLNKIHERVGRLLFRVGASLLALILSITFANQRVDYFKLKSSIEGEASKLVDIHMDLELFETEGSRLIQSKVRDYVLYISQDGWKSLHEDPFLSRSFVLFREIYYDINHLVTESRFQEKLKENLIHDIDFVSDYLQSRLYSTRPESNHLIYTTIFGLIVIMILFSVYPPDKITIIFLGLYVAFIGVILYFILMMSNPLKGPLQLAPKPFHILEETIKANLP